jgi:trans-2,3-dihydro-3-hydroxyanthranilate isomerase
VAAARPRPLTWLDVFTGTPLTGNQLAVVHDADGLDDATMQAFARETRLSETTFVQSADAEGADYRNRIFMTTAELPFAGHPTLGTAVAVALARGDTDVRYVQQTGAGLQPVDVRIADGRISGSMLQEPAVFGTEVDPATALAAVGLEPGDRGAHRLVPQIVSTGVAQLIVPVQRRALMRVIPDADAIAALLRPHDAVCIYLAAWEPGSGRASARSFFLDVAGVTEDPATGSAAGPLMAYLNARNGAISVDVEQGVEIGRPSLLRCSIDDQHERVRVGGDAVVIAEGTVHL